MRDFPIFTTENGVGSLVLREIPYSGIAYLTINSSLCPKDFLNECAEFCKVVGEIKFYASGHAFLESYPYHSSVLRMSASMEVIPDTDALLFPVTDKTSEQWREIYNNKMSGVDNASYLSSKGMIDLLNKGSGYFIHRDGVLLGIGIASDDRIDCVASVVPGAGADVIAALTHALMCETVNLEVSSTNHRAISLYERLGFIKNAEISRWYKIF